MFFHNLKYSLKTLFKNKMLIFWTFAFPIILGTFFNMAFSNLTKNEKLDIIDIAIVNNRSFKNNEALKTAFEDLSDKDNSERLFNIKYTTEEEAKKLLQDDKISGYLEIEKNSPKIVILNNGINQTVFKYVTEEIWQTINIVTSMAEKEIKQQITDGNFNIDYEDIINNATKIVTEDSNIKIKDISSKRLDMVMIEFYTLIAMAALYGGMLSINAINQSMPNLSNKGKRISISPTKKSTIILSNLLSSYITQIIGLVLLFIYTIFVLKVDYGSNIGLVILLALVGSLAGLALGLVIGTLNKNENSKTGILISITMLCCYLSGMMGVTMKYVVDKNVPIINKINPASMITDGFYSLSYYDTLNNYWFNIISLLIFASILTIFSFLKLRRQKYDSI